MEPLEKVSEQIKDLEIRIERSVDTGSKQYNEILYKLVQINDQVVQINKTLNPLYKNLSLVQENGLLSYVVKDDDPCRFYDTISVAPDVYHPIDSLSGDELSGTFSKFKPDLTGIYSKLDEPDSLLYNQLSTVLKAYVTSITEVGYQNPE